MAVELSGRVELTWTNKHLRLLSNEDGGYTWLPPADYRVAEVRLLHDVEEVGETHAERHRAKDNLLIAGDALNALTSLCELPDYDEPLEDGLPRDPDTAMTATMTRRRSSRARDAAAENQGGRLAGGLLGSTSEPSLRASRRRSTSCRRRRCCLRPCPR